MHYMKFAINNIYIYISNMLIQLFFIISILIILILIYRILNTPLQMVQIRKSKLRNAGRGIFALRNIYNNQLIEKCPVLVDDTLNTKRSFSRLLL